jgi:hypothetical protein
MVKKYELHGLERRLLERRRRLERRRVRLKRGITR